MRAETAVSTVATSRPQTASAPPELPFWLPGIGAWPGHVITRIEGGQPVAVWRYEMSSLGGRKVAGQRALTGLSRVTAEDAAHILEALQSERAALPTQRSIPAPRTRPPTEEWSGRQLAQTDRRIR